MDQNKFQLNQQVKFTSDSDRLTGVVKSFSYDSDSGYSYIITSKYYDPELHEMVDGIKICKESELTDMTGYTGDVTPPIPTQTVAVSDTVAPTTPDPTTTADTPTDPAPTDPATTGDTPTDTTPTSTDTTQTNAS